MLELVSVINLYIFSATAITDIIFEILEAYAKVSNGYLSAVENGKTGIPSPKILAKLAPVYKISIDELMQNAGWTDKITSIVNENDCEDAELNKYIAVAKEAMDKGIPLDKFKKLIDLL